MFLWKILGVLGLLCISGGVLIKQRKLQDEFYIAGGLLLLFYSISIRDWIFIILQIVFVLIAVYDLFKKKTNKRQSKRM